MACHLEYLGDLMSYDMSPGTSRGLFLDLFLNIMLCPVPLMARPTLSAMEYLMANLLSEVCHGAMARVTAHPLQCPSGQMLSRCRPWASIYFFIMALPKAHFTKCFIGSVS